MAFAFTRQHAREFQDLGFTIFRELVPPALLTDLRRESDKARILARKQKGEQAQRLQPLVAYPEIDMRPFDDYHHLPALQSALDQLFANGFGGKVDIDATRPLGGILLEPAAMPWSTHWHRDWRDNKPGLDLEAFDKVIFDIRYFNQVNCALYEDTATWVVPGSHSRRDTEDEVVRFPQRPIPKPALEGLTAEEAERAGLDYARSMPGAVQAHLNAGDYLLYRAIMWHLGNYVPYRKRATIHEGIITPEFREFFDHPPVRRDSEGKEIRNYQNPNADSPAYQHWAAQQAESTPASTVLN